MSTFWSGKKVLLTGHTGFKGTWLTLLLREWGAKVYGYALPPAALSMYHKLDLANDLAGEKLADICDSRILEDFYRFTSPDITIHMAAQALVLPSYANPIETFRVNAVGTATLLDIIRAADKPQTAIIVTSDKVYQNHETGHSYTENDRLGGGDPYSASKACAEIITASFRHSFFDSKNSKIIIKTARAGNVIGGGDYSAHRLIPDAVRAVESGQKLILRNPLSVRPWQHVLEPLSGYLLFAEHTATGSVSDNSLNFGPTRENCQSVASVIEKLGKLWGNKFSWTSNTSSDTAAHPEAHLLHLESSNAFSSLMWKPRWNLDTALAKTVEGYNALREMSGLQARSVIIDQIKKYFSS